MRRYPILASTCLLPIWLLLACPLAVRAAPPGAMLARLADLPRAPLAAPLRVGDGAHPGADPLVADGVLYSAPPAAFGGLLRVEKAGLPLYDRSTGAWVASANGAIVRLEEGGGLTVVGHGVQGTDLDVREGLGLAVSREPDDTIVLHRLGRRPDSRVLLRGAAYFEPRFSPAGERVLVAESRPGGGHMWVAGVAGEGVRDLGQGYGAVWHPDGRRIVFCRIEHDGRRILASDLFVADAGAPGNARRLAATPGVAEIEPAVSEDGSRVVYVDALTGGIFAADLPAEKEVER